MREMEYTKCPCRFHFLKESLQAKGVKIRDFYKTFSRNILVYSYLNGHYNVNHVFKGYFKNKFGVS